MDEGDEAIIEPSGNRTLSYASRPAFSGPLSRLAVASLALALFGDPYLIWMLMAMIRRDYVGAGALWCVPGMMALTIVLPVVAIVRIRRSHGMRRGAWLAYTALAVAIGWTFLLIGVALALSSYG